MKFDTEKEGLLTVFKPYQASLMEHIWEVNRETRTGITSGKAHVFLHETGEEDLMKSRASVIYFLEDMVELGVLEREERSGKGGYHGVYYPKMAREEFGQYVTNKIMDKLKTLRNTLASMRLIPLSILTRRTLVTLSSSTRRN